MANEFEQDGGVLFDDDIDGDLAEFLGGDGEDVESDIDNDQDTPSEPDFDPKDFDFENDEDFDDSELESRLDTSSSTDETDYVNKDSNTVPSDTDLDNDMLSDGAQTSGSELDAELKKYENMSDEELDSVITKLQSEIISGQAMEEPTDEEDSGGQADDKGTVIDKNYLIGDDESNSIVISKSDGFIAPNGEIVVMEPSDDENNFELVYVDIENISVVQRIRNSTNVEDLIKSIKSTGLLKPIDVAPMAADGIYVLLDGYRRVLACARAGKCRIPCVVNKKVSVPDIPILEAMYNHSKKYTIKEIITYIEYLEKEKGIMSASMIEYLLQMNSGDYTKLKDILNDNDEDIVDKLMSGVYTIDAAFKKLEQRRKKESAEEKELKRAAKVYDEGEESEVEHISESGEMGDEREALTDSELKQLAVSAADIADVDNDDLKELIDEGNNISGFQPHKQDPKYRERLDPTLRKSVLSRDNNTCQICEMISGMEFVEVLDVHHIQEVYLGGSDDINNLITACTVCHKLIHLHGRGELYMRPLDELSESEQRRFKRIIKLGNKIRMDMKMKGMKVDQLKKMDNTETIGRTKPGTGQTAG